MANIDTSELIGQAADVLKKNDRGGWTVPSGELYPHQWLWDSCFIAIGLRHLDVERAKTELESLRRGQWSNGMLPDMIFGREGTRLDEILWDSAISPFAPTKVATSGITQPPMLAEAVLKVGEKLKLPERRTWFKQMLPSLIEFHQWIYSERDPSGEGLAVLVHPYESGLDNSPPWITELHTRGIPAWVKIANRLPINWLVDLIRRDTRHAAPSQRMNNTEALSFYVALRRLRRQAYNSQKILTKPYFAIQDLVFNCVLIRSNSALAEIAKTAGRDLPADLSENMQRSQNSLEILWDEAAGQYFSRSFIRGELIAEPSIATLLPLYAGCISEERAGKLVSMLNKRSLYKSVWPIPSTPKSSGYYNPNRYWQGPSWLNMNWLVIQGLRNYGFNDEAERIDRRSIEMVGKNGFSEYFNPETGQGLGAEEFSWTAALTIDLLKS